MRATEYYIATIQNRCSWKAYPCTSYSDFEEGRCQTCNGECPTMGYGADHTKRIGTFYLKTNNKAPFCGKYASCFSCSFGFPVRFSPCPFVRLVQPVLCYVFCCCPAYFLYCFCSSYLPRSSTCSLCSPCSSGSVCSSCSFTLCFFSSIVLVFFLFTLVL